MKNPRATRLKWLALAALLALGACQHEAGGELFLFGQPASGAVRAEKQMIVASHPLAAEAGRDILRRGGSAVDAAIAAAARPAMRPDNRRPR